MHESLSHNDASAHSVQLAVFEVSGTPYAVDIMRVREIIRRSKNHPIYPLRPRIDGIEGMLYLHGKLIPVVDLCFVLGVEQNTQSTSMRKILIVTLKGRLVGLCIDHMSGVIRVQKSDLRPSPDALDKDQMPFFLGVCDFKGKIINLLDLHHLILPKKDIVAKMHNELKKNV